MNAHTAQILYAATSVAFVALGAYHFRRGVTLARKGHFPFRRKLFGSLSMALAIAWGALWIWAGYECHPKTKPERVPAILARSSGSARPGDDGS